MATGAGRPPGGSIAAVIANDTERERGVAGDPLSLGARDARECGDGQGGGIGREVPEMGRVEEEASRDGRVVPPEVRDSETDATDQTADAIDEIGVRSGRTKIHRPFHRSSGMIRSLLGRCRHGARKMPRASFDVTCESHRHFATRASARTSLASVVASRDPHRVTRIDQETNSLRSSRLARRGIPASRLRRDREFSRPRHRRKPHCWFSSREAREG